MSENVFTKLYQIDVSGRIEKKNGLSYLSWAWAWQEVLKVDPAATWEVKTYGAFGACVPYMMIGTSAMVHVSVTINGLARDCMLPVMDHRNKAIANPDARNVSDSIMRCMVKAVAMHGLGLFIYAGEDLPEASEEDRKAADAKAKALEDRQNELTDLAMVLIDFHKSGKDMDAVRLWYAPDTFAQDSETANDERLHVWGMLKTESALRSAIKANKPATAA